MSRPTSAADTARPPHATRALLGLLAAPTAWIVQGLLGWWLGAGVCAQWSVGSVRTALGVVGITALAIALAGLASTLRLRRSPAAPGVSDDDTREFELFAAAYVSTAFAIAILWATLNALLITGCGVAR